VVLEGEVLMAYVESVLLGLVEAVDCDVSVEVLLGVEEVLEELGCVELNSALVLVELVLGSDWVWVACVDWFNGSA
jgi:hypothetical protein